MPKKSKSSSGGNKGLTPTQKVTNKLKEMLKEVEALNERLPEIEREAENKISYAKERLMQLEPFFAMLLFKLPPVPCYHIPTMATDGLVLMYNPIFVGDKLLRKDTLFVHLHEVEHIFFKHHIRGPIKAADAQKLMDVYRKGLEKGKKDIFLEQHVKDIQAKFQRWNHATDYVINLSIRNDVKLPCSEVLKKEMLYDEKYKGMTSEQVFKKLEDEDKKNKGGKGKGSSTSQEDIFGMGGILPAGLGELTEQEIAKVEKDLENEVRAAALSAKKAGKLPKGIEQAIEDIYSTSTPWQDVFRTIFTQISKQDYTFQYPNKRYSMHQVNYGVIMPSLWGEEYTDAWFIMDTSGSVGDRERKILVSELRHILEDYPIRLHVIYCDTKAYLDNIETLTREDIQNGKLRLNVKGGGGTDMRPAFKHINDQLGEINPEVVICLTDMYLSSWNLGPEPEYSVFWARLPGSASTEPPWGVCVDIVLDGEK